MLTLLAQVNVSVDSLSMTTYWGIELANINRPPRFEHGRQFWVYWLGGHGWESGWRLVQQPPIGEQLWLRPTPLGWFLELEMGGWRFIEIGPVVQS